MIYKYLETYRNIEIMDDHGDWRIRTAGCLWFFSQRHKFVDKAHEYPL